MKFWATLCSHVPRWRTPPAIFIVQGCRLHKFKPPLSSLPRDNTLTRQTLGFAMWCFGTLNVCFMFLLIATFHFQADSHFLYSFWVHSSPCSMICTLGSCSKKAQYEENWSIPNWGNQRSISQQGVQESIPPFQILYKPQSYLVGLVHQVVDTEEISMVACISLFGFIVVAVDFFLSWNISLTDWTKHCA